MKKSRVFSFVALGGALIALVSIFLPFYDFSKLFGELGDLNGVEIKTTISIFDVIRGGGMLGDMSAQYGLGSISEVLAFAKVFLMFPYFLILIMAALTALNKKASHIVNAVFSLLITIVTFVIHFFLISGAWNSIYGGLGAMVSDVPKYTSFLSFGFYAELLGLIVLAVFSIMACSAIGKEAFMQPPVPNGMPGSNMPGGAPVQPAPPLISVIRGPLVGATCPMQVGEMIVIGRDPAQCHFVIDGNESISRKHCSVSFDPVTDQYRVQDFSRNGTYYGDGSRKLIKNSPTMLPRGTVILLGDKNNGFELK